VDVGDATGDRIFDRDHAEVGGAVLERGEGVLEGRARQRDHVGLYAYRRAALERFVSLAPSYLERREKLEQLRALEAGMRIDVEIVRSVPLGVDTPHDLERARTMLSHR